MYRDAVARGEIESYDGESDDVSGSYSNNNENRLMKNKPKSIKERLKYNTESSEQSSDESSEESNTSDSNSEQSNGSLSRGRDSRSLNNMDKNSKEYKDSYRKGWLKKSIICDGCFCIIKNNNKTPHLKTKKHLHMTKQNKKLYSPSEKHSILIKLKKLHKL